MGRFAARAALLSLVAVPVVPAQQAPSANAAKNVTAPFVGEWTGQLEYRDFQSDERVHLPAWLTVKPGSLANTLEFTYTYDDSPSKVVVERSVVTIDPAARRYMV